MCDLSRWGNKMAAQGITVEAMRALMRRHGFELCEKCVARYVPCVVLVLQYARDRMAHIMPVVHEWDAWRGERWARRSYVGRLCDGLCPAAWEGKFVAVHAALDRRDFVEALLEHYPELAGKPLTEELLEQVGCDLEAELAMWSLSK
jgi:hypothetical protein